jgi:RNA polymerase sigma-70 factor (ECF subfamily)
MERKCPGSGIYMHMGWQDFADVNAFERAYAAHRAAMIAVAHQVLRDVAAAEDVVQDVFLQLWLAPQRYDSRRGSLRGYLMVLARSRAVDRWRSRSVAGGVIDRIAAQTPLESLADESAADRVIRSETVRAVRAAVDALPSAQREALVLAYGGGLTAPELASVTGAPLGTAKSRVRLGLRSAGKLLAAQG